MKSCALIVAACTTGIAITPSVGAAQTTVPRLKFDRPEWTSSESFSEVGAVRVLSNGSVLVADTKDMELHLLEANGTKTRRIGRKGSGPAEYERLGVLVPLRADSTLLVDLGARRYLIIDPRGQVITSESVSPALGGASDGIAGADPQGRLYFGLKMTEVGMNLGAATPIGRWTRGSDHFDTVTMFQTEDPVVRPVKAKNAPINQMTSRSREVFAAADDWIAAPSGRIAMIHAIPYRVDWVELNGKTTVGIPVAVQRVPVTERDRKQREPAGPPYRRTYAALKSPFITEQSVVDDQDNVWVPRFEAADFTKRHWDVFSRVGRLSGTVLVPRGRRLVAVNRTHAYVSYTDSDGLQWIERYKR